MSYTSFINCLLKIKFATQGSSFQKPFCRLWEFFMDQASLYATEARCTQEHMPKCQSHCPLHMDVRAFMACMSDGSINEARKIMERHMPLPSILAEICDHPCESHCLRRDLGGSLAIQSLESLCINNTQKAGKGFLRPPKHKKTAVLGNGLSGLVVAFELAKKSWPVTIYYADNVDNKEVYSFIIKQFPNITLKNIQEECANLEKQHVKFIAAKLDVEFFASLYDQYDAFYIDAHAAPDLFASFNQMPTLDTGHLQDNICAGGMLQQSPTGSFYASTSTQAGQGRCAALSIERILGGINVDAGRESQNTKDSLHTSLKGVGIVETIIPTSSTYSMDEAQAEAARCIQCQCMQCVKECVYLQKYGSFPRSYTRQIYNNAAIVQGERRANSLVNGCMLCGQCTEICPERFSMAEVCLQAREDMVTRKYMPASAHAFALNDLEAATSSSATLFMGAAQNKDTKFAFFPGCQLTASRGKQISVIYNFLCKNMEQGVGLMLSCCGTPATWAGHKDLAKNKADLLYKQWKTLGKPTLILACASCQSFFNSMLTDIKCVSLWEVLYELRQHIKSKITNLTCTIHDPCAARHDQKWQDNTRLLAAHCGVQCTEANNAKETTHCCGYGGLVWCAQPELAAQATQKLAQNLGEHTALASCIMCRDRLISSDKDCLHMLDILPFIEEAGLAHTTHAKAPSLSAKRVNRVNLVNSITEKYATATILPNISENNTPSIFPLNSMDIVHGHSFLHIDSQLLSELEQKHILHQDVAAAVLGIEKHGHMFVEKESGHYVGAWSAGAVTFWVRYAKDKDNKYVLHDAWSHRMYVANTDPNAVKA